MAATDGADAPPGASDAEPDNDLPWDPWHPDTAAARLAGVTTRWYVVAGWAVDLFLGEQTRPHEDLEIGIPSSGFAEVAQALDDLEFEVVGDNERFPVTVSSLEAHFQTWGRDPATGCFVIDVFRDPHDDDTWLCRRDMSIRRPYATLIRHSSSGVPYLCPEVVMLFKAKHRRPKDEADWQRVRPRLDDAASRWLADALDRVHPGHPWRAGLPGSPAGR